MENRRFLFWQKWLTYANAFTILVGIMVAFGGDSIFLEIHNNYTREVFFQGEDFPAEVLIFKKWLFGIIGGTIVGFHVLMLMISEYSLKKKELWAYKALWYGLISWFLIDSGISMYYGAIHNVILINFFALVLIGLPLVMTRKAFQKVAFV